MRATIFCVIILIFFLSNTQGATDSAEKIQTSVPDAASKSNATATTGPSHPETLLILVILIMVLFAITPLLWNIILAHRHLERTDDTLGILLKEHKEELDDSTTLQIIKEYVEADPGGAPGTARGIMAMTIIVIVGICLVFLLLFPPAKDEINQTIREVILTLTGALTTIVGFYFGGNGSTEPKTTTPTTQAPNMLKPEPAKEERQSVIYTVKKEFEYGDRKYNLDENVDLKDIPANVLKEWIDDKKVELFAGDKLTEDKKIPKEILATDNQLKPGWYRIKSNFKYRDNSYIAGNIMNLKDVSAKLLGRWKELNWIDDYSGPVVTPEEPKPK
jgi:hypothetical protein